MRLIRLVAALSLAPLVLVACGDEGSAPVQETGPFQVREDTTRITQPLGADGMVDYAAALNAVERPAAGENAAIPLARVIGSRGLTGDARVLAVQLGVTDELPTEPLFMSAQDPDLEVEIGDATYAIEDVDEHSDEWTRSKALGAWLDRNGPAFDQLIEASRRPRLWWPIVPAIDGGMIDTAMPPAALQDAVEGLALRAARSTLTGDVDAGWVDAQALLRLGVLMDASPGTLSRMVAGGVSARAMNWVRLTLEHATPTETQSRAMLAALGALPRPRAYLEDVDRFDRFMVLEGFIRLAGGVGSGAALHPALRAINAAVDDVVQVLRTANEGTHAALEAHVQALSGRIKRLNDELEGAYGKLRLAGKAMLSHGAHATALVGEITGSMVVVVVPTAFKRLQRIEVDRAAARVALAVHIHGLTQGHFPQALSELVPSLLPELPSLDHVGSSVRYALTEDGCRVGGADVDTDWSVALSKP